MSPATIQGVRTPVGQYPRPSVLQVLAQGFGVQASTAAQMRAPADPRCPAARLARAITALRHYGYQEEAQRLARPVLLALQPLPLSVTRARVLEALMEEQETDGAEDAAQVALLEWTDAALDTWLTRAERQYNRLGRAIALAQSYLGRGV